MAVRIFTKAKKKLVTGVAGIKLDGDLRLLLCMTNTDADTIDIDTPEFLDDFVLDEADGAGYARVALSAATPTVAEYAANHSVRLTTATHPVFPSLAAGTRNIAGVLLYWNVLGDDSQSVPLMYMPYTTPRVPDGGDFTIELPTGKLILEVMQVADDTAALSP